MIGASLIREARLRAGLTQGQLASRAGNASSAIGRWERGEVKPAMATVVTVCRAAGFELTFSLTPGDAHDRALIRACLNRSPAERLADMVIAVRAFDRMAAAAERHGRV